MQRRLLRNRDEIDCAQLPDRIRTYSADVRGLMATRQLTLMCAAPTVLHDPQRITPLPLAFSIEGANQKLDNVLKGIEQLPLPPTPDEPGLPGPDLDL